MSSTKTFRQRADHFLSAPHDPAPLGVFRILIAAFVLLQAFLWYSDWLAFFGPDAWIQWEISRALIPSLSIHISQVCDFFSLIGLNAEQSVILFFWIYVVCAAGLLLGYYTRAWAILTWFCHYVLMCTIDIYVYGVDIFLHIALFYLMLMPAAKAYSLDAKFRRINSKPTWGVTLGLRVLQIHLCLAYLSAGFEKMLSHDWWNGNVLWRSLVQPDFSQYDLSWLAHAPWLPMLLSWSTMIIETFYGVAMWIPRLRTYWLMAIICLHIGIGIFLGLWLFGLIMVLLSISAFGYDALKDIRAWRSRRKARLMNASATLKTAA